MTTTKTKSRKKAGKTKRWRRGSAPDSSPDRAAELAELAERAGAIAQERAKVFAERLRESEALAKAQTRGGDLAGLAQAKGGELAALAKSKWQETELDARASALATQLREADRSKAASKRARDMTDATLAALGGWLVAKPAADKMGLMRKPRVPGWLWAVLGAGIGFAVAQIMAGQSDRQTRQDLTTAAERLADQASPSMGSSMGASMGTSTSAPGGLSLADEVRTTLEGDPRTADLRELDINVAEGTVFVRGSLPTGIDSAAVRQVIERVPGVRDVDLQLTPSM